jgi:uncharacterized protein
MAVSVDLSGPRAVMPAAVHRATPFTEFVLKVNSSCSLACDYCYMYESVDQSWQRSLAMSGTVLAQTAVRIAEHAERHCLTGVRVVFHGGEPLLSGPDTLARAADTMRGSLPALTRADFTVQTNGLAITRRSMATLGKAGIRIGVSVDGGRQATDRHRRFRSGQSSYPALERALDLLARHPDAFAGVLAVVDLDNPPVDVYESLLRYRPPAMDLLLPHGNWSNPPPRRPPDDTTPYGDWLVAVFDRWYRSPVQETRVRLFTEIINGILGGSSRSESVGLSPVAVVVVDVDGALEQTDTLRTTYVGATGTGMNVFDNSFDEALTHQDVIVRQSGLRALSNECLECPIHRVCGGGYYPHRYRAGSGFRSPSVYCADLRRIITHIADSVRADVARIVRKRS